MTESTRKTPHEGYLSEQSKRTFTITAGILGAVFFIAQFVVPFVVMMVVMPGMMIGMTSNLKEAHPERGAYWKERAWYVESAAPFEPKQEASHLLRALPLSGEADAEDVAELGAVSPWLLPDGERLWVISASYLGEVRHGTVRTLVDRKTLGDISRPFLYEGRPALFESSPRGERLLVLSGNRWIEKKPVDFGLDPGQWSIEKDLQAYWDGTRVHVLLKYGKTLFHLPGLPGTPGADSWQPVAETCRAWTLTRVNDRPAVFVHRGVGNGPGSQLTGYELNGGSWNRILEDKLLPGNTGAFWIPESSSIGILHQLFPGSLRYREYRDGELARQFRRGSGSPFPKGFMGMMMIPQFLTLLMPFVLAVILSGLMKKHRVARHGDGDSRLSFASLTRRALAQLVDGLIFGGPLAAGGLIMFQSVFDFEKMMEAGPLPMFAGFGLIGFGMLWMLAVVFLFSFTEGRWGVTPGKRLLKIRVLGTDHRPCGFGRALVRNLLKFVDGFFNFLVGVMVVALSENWQRVGDMAARTVVVEMKELPATGGTD